MQVAPHFSGTKPHCSRRIQIESELRSAPVAEPEELRVGRTPLPRVQAADRMRLELGTTVWVEAASDHGAPLEKKVQSSAWRSCDNDHF
jgi:hypothetical protein